MTNDARGKRIDEVISKALADESFKKKLLSSPAATLKAEGVDIPEGVQVRAFEDTDTVFHVVVPAKSAGQLSDQQLDAVSGAGFKTRGR